MAAIRELEPVGAGDTVELMVGGMTCASCAARVQRRLNKLPGVDAAVNYATERATVRLVEPGGAPPDGAAGASSQPVAGQSVPGRPVAGRARSGGGPAPAAREDATRGVLTVGDL